MKTHLHLNRPVHLAMRDACFERAIELLCIPMTGASTASRRGRIADVSTLLDKAFRQTEFASRVSPYPSSEEDFLHFLELIRENVLSLGAMLKNQDHLQENEGFLCQFLGANSDQCLMPAMAYKRRAEDILQGLWHVLRLAHAPYRKLQNLNENSMDESMQLRYQKAYERIRDEVTREFSRSL